MKKKITTSYTLSLDLVAEIQRRAINEEMKASPYVEKTLRAIMNYPLEKPKIGSMEKLQNELSEIKLKEMQIKESIKKIDEEKQEEKKKLIQDFKKNLSKFGTPKQRMEYIKKIRKEGKVDPIPNE